MNKRAGEKLLSMWWFIVLAFVGAAIVIGVFIFYSANVDVRGVEASLLSDKILSCLSNNGYLNENALRSDFNIFQECRINEALFRGDSSFYFLINFYDESGKKLREQIEKGTVSFREDCGITMDEKVQAPGWPKCVENSKEMLYFENTQIKKIKIEILAGSNQQGKKTA